MNKLTVICLSLSCCSIHAAPRVAWFQSLNHAASGFEFGAATTTGPGIIRSTGFDLHNGLRLRLSGANRVAGYLAGPRFPVTQLIGASPRHWTGAQSALFPNVYPGIDLRFHLDGGALEYDIIVHPGARLDRVRIASNEPFHVEKDGSVRFRNLTQSPAAAWLDDGRPVNVRYDRCGPDLLCLKAETHHRSSTLTVDPVIHYAAYFGSTQNDYLGSITSDAQGNLYVIGQSPLSADLGVFTAQPAQLDPKASAGTFAAKFSPDGQIVYLIFYAASYSTGMLMTVDSQGALYAAAYADPRYSPPGTTGSWIEKPTQTLLVKLNAAGDALAYATFLPNQPIAMIADSDGNLLLSGVFGVTTTPGAFSEGPAYLGSTAQLIKLNATGTALLAATNLETAGDSINALAFDPQGDLVVAGSSTSTISRTGNAMQPGNNSVPAYRSVDQGSTWQRSQDLTLAANLFQDRTDGQRLWKLSNVDLLVSDDFGQTWTTRASFGTDFTPVALTTVRDQPQWLLLLGTFGQGPLELNRSSDGGLTWTRSNGGYYGGFAPPEADPTNPTRMIRSLFGSVQVSTDAGDSWFPIQSLEFYYSNPRFQFSDAHPGEVMIEFGSSNGGYIFNFDTSAVVLSRVANVSDGIVDPTRADRIYLVQLNSNLVSGNIYTSLDGGRTGVKTGAVPTQFQAGAFPFSTGTLVPDTHVEGTLYWRDPLGSGFQRSTDFGATWQPFGAGAIPPGGMFFVHPQTGELLLSKGFGADALIASYSADLSTRNWSTLAGGDGADSATSVAVDAGGTITVTGNTNSLDFNTLYQGGDWPRGIANQFVLKLSGDGSTKLAFREFGSSDGMDLVVGAFSDQAGNTVVLSQTNSTAFPVTDDLLANAHPGPPPVAVYPFTAISILGPDLATLYASYISGNADGTFLAAPAGPEGAIWLAASTSATNLPVSPNALMPLPLGANDLYFMVFDWQH